MLRSKEAPNNVALNIRRCHRDTRQKPLPCDFESMSSCFCPPYLLPLPSLGRLLEKATQRDDREARRLWRFPRHDNKRIKRPPIVSFNRKIVKLTAMLFGVTGKLFAKNHPCLGSSPSASPLLLRAVEAAT
jgi:hypothetical protein